MDKQESESNYITDYLPVSHDNQMVFFRGWLTKGKEVGVPLIVLHGLGDTSDSYQGLLNTLFENGFQSCSFDFRGHGQSASRLVNATGVNWFVQDLLQVASWIKFKTRQRPLVLAEGFSGLVAYELQKKWPDLLRGIVVSDMPVLSSLEHAPINFWLKMFSESMPKVAGSSKILPEEIRNIVMVPGKKTKLSVEMLIDLRKKIIEFNSGDITLNVPFFMLIDRAKSSVKNDQISNRFMNSSVSKFLKWDFMNEGHSRLSCDFNQAQSEVVDRMSQWVQNVVK